MSILNDGSIAELVGDVCGDLFGEPMTIQRRSTGVDADGVPMPTFADHAAVGTLLQYSDRRRHQSGIPAGDVMLLIYQNSTAIAPRSQDRVRVGSVVYDCVIVTPDPANATWEIQARRVHG